MYPELVPEEPKPRTLAILGDGYILMGARERSPHYIKVQSEVNALHVFLQGLNINLPNWSPYFQKWARLRIPTGQIARTAWRECEWEAAKKFPRRARMVRVCLILILSHINISHIS